jgi:hypothetical protein
LTSAQFFAQRLRQVIASPQTAQGLLGSVALLPRKRLPDWGLGMRDSATAMI